MPSSAPNLPPRIALVLALWLAWVTPGARAGEPTALNEAILRVIADYPTGGAHPYSWRANHHTDGTTRDLYLGDVRLAQAAGVPPGVHCSGVTWEVFLRALGATDTPQAAAPPLPVPVEALVALKEAWYVRDGGESGLVEGLVAAGLGVRVEGIDDLAAGDLLQLWKNDGRGHTAVFLEHRRDARGKVVGLRYWSAQASTGGIGSRTATLGTGPYSVARLYAVRATLPGPPEG